MMNVASRRAGAVTLGTAVLAAAATMLAACGGGSNSGTPSVPFLPTAPAVSTGSAASVPSAPVGSGGGSAAPPAAGSPPSTPAPQKIDIGKTVYYGGFKVTVNTLTYTPGEGMLGGEATFDAQFANEGTDATSFDADVPMDLAVGDNHYKVDNLQTDFPQVPGKAQGEGTFGFIVDKTFVPAQATLTIGDAAHAQAVVPLGGGTLVTLAPVRLQLPSGKIAITAGALTITLRSAELRASVPANHEETAKDKRELLVDFDAALGKYDLPGYNLFSKVFTLTLPDGTSVSADEGFYNVNEILHANTGKTGLKTAFTVDAPADGTYRLTITGVDADNNEVNSKPATFSITGSS